MPGAVLALGAVDVGQHGTSTDGQEQAGKPRAKQQQSQPRMPNLMALLAQVVFLLSVSGMGEERDENGTTEGSDTERKARAERRAKARLVRQTQTKDSNSPGAADRAHGGGAQAAASRRPAKRPFEFAVRPLQISTG